MRTSYYLVTAAGLAAAAVTVYARLPAADVPPPTLPLPADPVAAGGAPPALPAVPDVPLPPVVTPPDGALVIPAVGVPPAARDTGVPQPIRPAPAALPALPTVPAVPVSVPTTPEPEGNGPPPLLPTMPIPVVPTLPMKADPGRAAPPTPVVPPVAPPAANPVTPVAPPPTTPPVPPVAAPAVPPARPTVAPTSSVVPPASSVVPPASPVAVPVTPSVPPVPSGPSVAPAPAPIVPAGPKPPEPEPKAVPLPAPTPFTPGLDALKPEPAANLAPAGNYVVLKGNKLVEGVAKVAGDKVTVRQGALDRAFPRADVLFVGESRDEVVRFMRARVPAGDAAGRLAVARWCMFSGLREQALAEAKEILTAHPADRAAADLARSLEESLRQFPPGGAAAKPPAELATVPEPEPDVTAEAATTFARRAQPVLANQCMECHARPDHASAFKLIRITGFEVGEVGARNTHANLRAVSAQLKKDDPQNSPLLAKALTAHGGMKQPAFVSRQAVAFRALESWVLVAAGSATAVVPPMTPPAQPVVPPSPPVTPIPPAAGAAPSLSPAGPAAETTPALPAVGAAPLREAPPITRPPSAELSVPPVLPTPPNLPPADAGPRAMPPTIPAVPPVGPPDAGSKPPAPAVPTIPVVPPAAATPGGVTGAGVKPPAAGPAGDEFDPAAFNRAAQPPK